MPFNHIHLISKKFLNTKFFRRNMRKEVDISIFAVLIVAAAILTVYYLNIGPTGFAVFQQTNQTAFDEGTYGNVLYNANASAVVLNTSANATFGTYTSKVFDSNNTNTTWNNLTRQGANVTFEVKTCSLANCSDSNFSAASNLSNLNLTGRYFQYRTTFDSANDTLTSVAIDYSVPAAPVVTSVSISQPSGAISSRVDIPIRFNALGTGLQCWYGVKSSNGSEVVANTTLSGCSNSTFSVSGDGDYVITVYANGSFGFALQQSSFLVSTSSQNQPVAKEKEKTPAETQPPPEVAAQEQQARITQISLIDVPSQDIIQGNSRKLTLSVQNTGTEDVSSCVIGGDDSGLITVSTNPTDLKPSDTFSFDFSVNVPEETVVAEYILELSVSCSETSAVKDITINVLQKKLDFNITNVQRTRANRVTVDYTLTELSGENQDLTIFFSIKDGSGLEAANVSQNSSIDANKTDDFRVNIPINESLEGNVTLSAAFNSQIYSNSVLEPITLGAPTGGVLGGFVIFGGEGVTGNIAIIVIVLLAIIVIFFVARKIRKSGKFFRSSKE